MRPRPVPAAGSLRASGFSLISKEPFARVLFMECSSKKGMGDFHTNKLDLPEFGSQRLGVQQAYTQTNENRPCGALQGRNPMSRAEAFTESVSGVAVNRMDDHYDSRNRQVHHQELPGNGPIMIKKLR